MWNASIRSTRCNYTEEIEPEAAGDLLNDFNLYNIVEQPELRDGDTISFTENSPCIDCLTSQLSL